jgi:hypothetical protein
MQTRFGVGEGNCFPACIASILEIPLEQVPHFFEGSAGGFWTQEQWDAVRQFALCKGLGVTWLDPDDPADDQWCERLLESHVPYVIFGKQRGGDAGHCVVGCHGEMVHDPHPGGKGLEGKPFMYLLFKDGPR